MPELPTDGIGLKLKTQQPVKLESLWNIATGNRIHAAKHCTNVIIKLITKVYAKAMLGLIGLLGEYVWAE